MSGNLVTMKSRMARPVSDETIKLICRSEGLKLTAYLCPAMVPTIGYGHTRGVTTADVAAKRTITQTMAEQLLRDDLTESEEAVCALGMELKDGQYGALVDLVFNCGPAPIKKGTTIRRLLDAGNYSAIPEALKAWCHGSGGVVLAGLRTRRAAEGLLWNSTPIGAISTAPALIEAAAQAAVHVQNATLVDASRVNGVVPLPVAIDAHNAASDDIINAVAPYIDNVGEHMPTLNPMINDAIEKAVAALKIDDALAALFPDN